MAIIYKRGKAGFQGDRKGGRRGGSLVKFRRKGGRSSNKKKTRGEKKREEDGKEKKNKPTGSWGQRLTWEGDQGKRRYSTF